MKRSLALAALEALQAAIRDPEGGRMALLLGRDLLALDLAEREFACRQAPGLRLRWLDLLPRGEREQELADLQRLVEEQRGPDEDVLALHGLEADQRVRAVEEARALSEGLVT